MKDTYNIRNKLRIGFSYPKNKESNYDNKQDEDKLLSKFISVNIAGKLRVLKFITYVRVDVSTLFLSTCKLILYLVVFCFAKRNNFPDIYAFSSRLTCQFCRRGVL